METIARVGVSLFVTGVVLATGPCLLSCGPLLVSYVTAARLDARGALRTYLVFSLTRVGVYFLLGGLIGFFGENVLRGILQGRFLGYFFAGGGFWVVVTGLFLALRKTEGDTACGRWHRLVLSGGTKNIVLFGLVTSLSVCWPLWAVLGYIVLVADTWVKGVIFMAAFGLGTVLSPVLLLALGLAGRVEVLTKGRQRWLGRIRFLAGMALVYLGVGLIIRGLLLLNF